MNERNSFITLTYDSDQLPENGSLDVSHWQKFAKRLRKKSAFRFFHCGEYGDENKRPHYHAILFGLDFSDDQVLIKEGKWGSLYTSPSLEKTWGKGYVTVGEATWQSAAYVARYIMKKVTGKDAEEHYGGKTPEYTTMSRRPGLGNSWFDKYNEDIYPHDEVIINGKPMRPPKYYDSLIPETDRANYRAQRRQRAAKRDNSEQRLKAREAITESKLTRLRRTV